MKSLLTALSNLSVCWLGIVGMTTAVVLFFLLPLVLTVYGLYLAFSASIVLGVLALLIEPSSLVFGVLALLGHPEVAHKIAAWLGL